MVVNSVGTLVDVITQHRLLLPAPLQELTGDLQNRFSDPRALARELIGRGWLTPYQVNLLMQGRAEELTLGPYLLQERLGESDTGQVYKARHRVFNRVVALRVIRKERLANPEALERFHQEIQAAAQLEHPNLVVAYDADSVGHTHFFSMEYVEGTNLERLVKECGPLPIEEVCEFVRQVASGLEHAYARGMVHGDLKPSDLILARKVNATDAAGTGTGGPASGAGSGLLRGALVKIVGLTHLQPTGKPAAGSLSVEADLVGSPDFLAPERAAAPDQADIRADLYSLGCTFYYLLTGWVPFPGGTVTEKLEKHRIQKPLPVVQLRPDVPPHVAAVVVRLMEKRPEDRFQTPAEVMRALSPTATVEPVTEPTPVPAPAAPRQQVTATPRPKPRTAVTPRSAVRTPQPTPRTGRAPVTTRMPPPTLRAPPVLLRAAPAGRYWILIGALGGALFLTLACLTWALFLRPAPKGDGTSEAPPVPAFPGMRYVRGPTRQETIIATLRSGGLPTLEGKWYYIGPFDNPEPLKGFDTVYPPEKEINLKKKYTGKGNQQVEWKEYRNFRVAEVNDLAALFPNANVDATVYLFHEINSQEQLALPVSLGSDDTLTVWLNQQQLVSLKVLRACRPDQDHATLQLQRGRNHLLVKVCNQKAAWEFYICPQLPKAAEAAFAGYLVRDFPPPPQ